MVSNNKKLAMVNIRKNGDSCLDVVFSFQNRRQHVATLCQLNDHLEVARILEMVASNIRRDKMFYGEDVNEH